MAFIPAGVAVDAAGNVYVADQSFTTIKKIPAGNGAVVDIGSGFNSPFGVAVDAAGNVYVGDSGNSAVKKIPSAGGAPVVLGSGFNQPAGVAVDALGNVYVADAGNNAVKEIQAAGGAVVTLGSGFNNPYGVAVDCGGNLFIADLGSNTVKAIFSGQTTPVVIGSGYFTPSGVAVDGVGNVYVADQGNSAVKRIKPAGGFYISAALAPGLNFDGTTGIISGTPTLITTTTYYKITGYNASSGSSAALNIYVNYNLGLSSLVVSAGTMSPAFTSGLVNYTDNITGTVSSVTFTPTLIDPEAIVTVNGVAVPSGTASAPIPFSGTSNIVSVVVSAPGTLATRVYTIKLIVPPPTISYKGPVSYTPGVTITPLTPTSTNVAAAGYSGRSLVTSAVTNPVSIVADLSGNVYLGTITGTSLTEIPAGGGSPVAYGSGLSSERGLAIDGAGNIYVADYAALAVKKIPAGGGAAVTVGSGFSGPFGIAVDPAGNVYVADRGSNTIKKIPVAGGATITVAAGFNNPSGVAVDSQGNIYVADTGNNDVKEIPANGGATISIGSGHGSPFGLAVDPSGNLFIAEEGIGRVKEVAADGTQVFIASGFLLNTGIAVDQYGDVYMTDSADNLVYSAKPAGGYHLSADLPAGLSFSSSTGVISGTPLASSPATNYTVTVYNSGGAGSAVVNVGVLSAATLKALTLSAGTLSPVFSGGTTSYTATVGNGITSLTVTPTAGTPTATIKVNGTAVTSGAASGAIALNIGSNTVTILVTAPDGITKQTYSITVTRSASANASLASMGASISPLTPAFTPATTHYTLSVPNATASMTVRPITSDPNATIKLNGTTITSATVSAPIALAEGTQTLISVVVTAPDGTTTKTYTITVTRAASTDASLSNIKLGTGTLSPTFAAATTGYTASVSNSTTSITLTPTTTDANATVKVNGTTVSSGTASNAIALNVGSNSITTVVTAQDGTTTKTYTVTVTRVGSANANLSSIGPSVTPLTPAFAPATTSYAISAANTVSTMTVKPVTSDANATMKVNGTTLASGTVSAPIALAVGANNISIVVTAQDARTTKTYTLTVTRASGGANSYEQGISVTKPAETTTMAEDGIIIHQGISPNGDGINDYLQIDNISQYPENKLTIMNRNGQLIFEAKGYNNSSKSFDGRSNKNGQMQLPGTYFFQLEYAVNGIIKHKTGFVLLKY